MLWFLSRFQWNFYQGNYCNPDHGLDLEGVLENITDVTQLFRWIQYSMSYMTTQWCIWRKKTMTRPSFSSVISLFMTHSQQSPPSFAMVARWPRCICRSVGTWETRLCTLSLPFTGQSTMSIGAQRNKLIRITVKSTCGLKVTKAFSSLITLCCYWDRKSVV